MIGSLMGKLALKRSEDIVVEVGGVGYEVTVGANTLSDLPEEGKGVFLFVHTHVRDDVLQLFGFATDDERRIFRTLLGISGIGPRVALNIVSSISHEEFLRAVEAEDIAQLTRIPGLGKKTAHRLVLELRGKLPRREALRDRVFDDALSALVNLGYRKGAALESVEKAYNNGCNEVEALIREALKHMTDGSDGKT